MIHYYLAAEQPDIELWLLDEDGALVDFTDQTLEFKLGSAGSEAVFTKTTGIDGAAGEGAEPDGIPNVTLSFSAGELDDIPADLYTWQIKATDSGLDRFYQGVDDFFLHDVIA